MIDKAKIENAALEIYSKHILRRTPAKSLTKIIQNEGLWFSEIEGNENFLGALIKHQNDPLHIVVRKDIKPIGRKNFTIAHELGHYVLKHDLHDTSIFCNNISEENETISDQENEANYFARCFLLPRERIIKRFTHWFRFRVSQTDRVYLSVETNGNKWELWKAISSNLKKQYVVSEAALKIRLLELGLISNF